MLIASTSLLRRLSRLDWIFLAVALGLIGWAYAALSRTEAGIVHEELRLGPTPVTVTRPADGRRGPVVVIAHGFAGSRQLMLPYAQTLARAGYTAVRFDFAGHGRNGSALTGSITDADGATRTLVEETKKVAAFARPLGDGRLAVLGHSMASDIIIRFAIEVPDVAATVAISMFSPAVTPTEPRNLLVIVGDFETQLKDEALRVVGMVAPGAAEPGVVYGDLAAGTARRAVFAPNVEHVGVLYAESGLIAAVEWLDGTFAIARAGPVTATSGGLAILVLLFGMVLIARPLARFLPEVSPVPAGAGLAWRRLWIVIVVPMVVTPLVLTVVPTHFLPVLVGDYLAVHFGAYGLLTAACLLAVKAPAPGPVAWRRAALASLFAVGFGFAALVGPLDRYVTSFVPGPGRGLLMAAMMLGTLLFFLAVEWATRGVGAARFGHAVALFAFLVSLGIAVALDFERLFFLVIIVPVIALFFLVYGLFGAFAYRATRHPLVGAVASAVAFAWAIGVTFPLIAG